MKKNLLILFLALVIVVLASYIIYITSLVEKTSIPLTLKDLPQINSNNINQDTTSSDVFAAFVVKATQPDEKYLESLLFRNNFFSSFEDVVYTEGSSKTKEKDYIDGIKFIDINGDGYYDIWINNPSGGTVRALSYYTLISDVNSRLFFRGPELDDSANYDAQTRMLEMSDFNACFGQCAWQEKFQWLGSNLLSIYSAAWDNVRDGDNVRQANLNENYKLDGGLDTLPLAIRKILRYVFQGKKLQFVESKITDATTHYWFDIIDQSKEVKDRIYITEFNNNFDLFLEDGRDNETGHSCYIIDQKGIVQGLGC